MKRSQYEVPGKNETVPWPCAMHAYDPQDDERTLGPPRAATYDMLLACICGGLEDVLLLLSVI